MQFIKNLESYVIKFIEKLKKGWSYCKKKLGAFLKKNDKIKLKIPIFEEIPRDLTLFKTLTFQDENTVCIIEPLYDGKNKILITLIAKSFFEVEEIINFFQENILFLLTNDKIDYPVHFSMGVKGVANTGVDQYLTVKPGCFTILKSKSTQYFNEIVSDINIDLEEKADMYNMEQLLTVTIKIAKMKN